MANERFITVNGHNGEFVIGPAEHIAAHILNWKTMFFEAESPGKFLELIRVFRIPKEAEVSPEEFKVVGDAPKICGESGH